MSASVHALAVYRAERQAEGTEASQPISVVAYPGAVALDLPALQLRFSPDQAIGLAADLVRMAEEARDPGVPVPLPHNRFFLVSSEDFDRVSAHRWCLHRGGGKTTQYVQRSIWLPDGRRGCISLHRFIVDAPPGTSVDHKNGDTLDNRRSNLRICTVRENTTNVTSSKNQKRGGYKGVSWHKASGKWSASIASGEVRPSNGKRKAVHLGLFIDPEDAARAYDRAAILAFGEFAALNFPAEHRMPVENLSFGSIPGRTP